MQTGVAKGLKVPCLFMIAEVSIRCQKNPRGWYTPYTRVSPPPNTPLVVCSNNVSVSCHFFDTTTFTVYVTACMAPNLEKSTVIKYNRYFPIHAYIQ